MNYKCNFINEPLRRFQTKRTMMIMNNNKRTPQIVPTTIAVGNGAEMKVQSKHTSYKLRNNKSFIYIVARIIYDQQLIKCLYSVYDDHSFSTSDILTTNSVKTIEVLIGDDCVQQCKLHIALSTVNLY